MLTGKKPAGCQYCWNIEALGTDLLSDRHIRNGSLYRQDRLQEIENNKPDFNVTPEYIELSFSNLCQMKCGYCHPKASSSYFNEIKKFGPYQSKNHNCNIEGLKILPEENNPYIEAFWRWWPELQESLRILRITGGEPLIQKSTFRLLQMLKDLPIPELELNINSNLALSNDKAKEVFSQLQSLKDTKSFRAFKLFSSLDTWGPGAEYIRSGLSLENFERNLLSFLKDTEFPITLMITFNIFSLPNFDQLLKKILEWRSLFSESSLPDRFHRLGFDISYLTEPLQFDIQLLPKDIYLPLFQKHLDFMKENLDDTRKDRFSFVEYQKLYRIYCYMKDTTYSEEKIQEGRKDFRLFFNDYDKRRNQDRFKTFPELKYFFDLCGQSL